jgi:outer membrane protein OmpA-like peptidoglycan-associated protein
MPLDPSRALAAARAVACRGAGVAALLAALGCADAGPLRWCALVGRCAPDEEAEAEVEVPPPAPVHYEPPPVEAPPIEGGRLLLRTVSFAPGSAEIDAGSAIVLDVAAGEILARTGVRIRIEGHTDGVGSPESNEALSQRRAEAVRRYLVRKGVAPQRLETRARGASSPVASNETEEGRARNRRVELVVL